MQVADRKVVTIDYTLTDEDGEVLDTSKGGDPLIYIHGSGSIVPGLENALSGKSAGDSVKVKVSPDEGYGTRDEELVQTVPRDRFGKEELEVGMQFQVQGEGGSLIVTVTSFDEKSVTLDGNHPLAGVTLSFDVKIVDVRDASLEELKHGHVHGPGGHHHH